MTGFRIASYNIHKSVGTDLRRRPDRICEVIRQVAPDIAVLQEADRRLPPRLPALDAGRLQSIAGMSVVPLNHGRPSLGSHGNVIAVGPDVTVEEAHYFDLPGLEPRGGIEAIVKVRGLYLRVVGVHLGLRRADRRRQLAALTERLAASTDMPVVVAGDMNERSLSTGLGILGKRMHLLAPGPSYHARMPFASLDRFALSRGLDVQAAGVETGSLARLASDHLPIWADLAVR